MSHEPIKSRLLSGDRAPSVRQRSRSGRELSLDETTSGYSVLCFFGSAADPHAATALKAAEGRADLFDGVFARFYGVSADAKDESLGRLPDPTEGFDVLYDFDNSVGLDYGSVTKADPQTDGPRALKRFWVIAGPGMEVLANIPFRTDRTDISDVLQMVERLSPPDNPGQFDVMAPVLFLPRVFEPELCATLVSLYDRTGGEESGFMKNADGLTVDQQDHSFKSRRDHVIEDKDLVRTLQMRMRDRVLPHIAKAYQFQVTRMERYIVSCYSAEDGGHFAPHRDDTTKGTAHRKFAVSINLNEDFDGGEVSFPEYGTRSFKAPAGGAVVFSCSLLHAVSRVTRGRRYAFLPFFYDEAAAQLRQENLKFLASQAKPSPHAAE